jgi:hypothetical protein
MYLRTAASSGFVGGNVVNNLLVLHAVKIGYLGTGCSTTLVVNCVAAGWLGFTDIFVGCRRDGTLPVFLEVIDGWRV